MAEAVNPVDELVRDAADQQRRNGVLPKVNDVRRYVQAIVEKAERKAEDSKPLIAAPRPREQMTEQSATKRTGALEKEYEKRLRRKGLSPLPGSWQVTRGPKQSLGAVDRRVMGEAEKRMRKRLRLLRSKPDWADKLKTINPLALQGYLGEEKRLHAEDLVRRVIKASEAVFGPWWNQKAKPVMFT